MRSVEFRGLLLDYAGVLDEPVGNGHASLLDVAGRVRAVGIRTGIVSNARSIADPGLVDRFDAVVLSGEVRVAKPNPEIFRLAAQRIGVDPSECVFVDDLPANVAGAVEAGMVGARHRDVGSTIEELAVLFGLDLAH